MTILVFNGDFKKLIPNGYKFHKLFAGNHKCYSYNVNNNDYDTRGTIWIWVSGRTIEIKDFHNYSVNVIDYLRNKLNTISENEESIRFNVNEKTSEVYDDNNFLGLGSDHIRREYMSVETAKKLIIEIDRLNSELFK